MTSLARIALATLCAAFVGVTASDAQTYPGVRFVAQLAGGLGGDPDGRGTAYVWADRMRNRICATIAVRNIQLPASSSLRVRTWAGPLIFMASPTSSGCMLTDEYTFLMINGMLAGTYPATVSVNNAQYGRALVGSLRRG